MSILKVSDRDGDGQVNFNEFILMHANEDAEAKTKVQG